MSVPVELSALREAIADHGAVAYLVTVNDDATPHVVSVEVGVQGDHLVVPAGRRTGENLARATTVTLLWPNGADPAYSLVVDATVAELPDEPGGPASAALRPCSAVLHRVAGATGEGPTCLPVDGSAAGSESAC